MNIKINDKGAYHCKLHFVLLQMLCWKALSFFGVCVTVLLTYRVDSFAVSYFAFEDALFWI